MSKAQKRRNRKKARMALPELAGVPKRQQKKRGRQRMAQIQHESERDAQKTALEARARMVGAKDLDAMRSQALGEAAGRAIYLFADKDAAQRLWTVYAGLTAAEERYARTILGKSLHAKCAKIEIAPERFEARPDDQPDLRSEDERNRDTINAWARWRGYLGCLPSVMQSDFWAVARGRVEPIQDGAITSSGHRFLGALTKLTEYVD